MCLIRFKKSGVMIVLYVYLFVLKNPVAMSDITYVLCWKSWFLICWNNFLSFVWRQEVRWL